MADINLQQIRFQLRKMTQSRIGNYCTPGLVSELITNGCVRLFTATRAQTEWITPHSHRYSFAALVLSGIVENTVYTTKWASDRNDKWVVGALHYRNAIGEYDFIPGDSPTAYCASEDTYRKGEVYAMRADEIHSIRFDKGTEVLMFEGPEETNETVILEPWVDNQRVPTFEVKSWMFKRENP